MVEKIAEKSKGRVARIITKAKAHTLTMEGNVCTGLIYEKGGNDYSESGPVILCSGGFGADFSQDSLLAKYRPDLMHLPTTNGAHCTGDGIKMGEAIGGKSIDLEWVQVHPTGLVKTDDPDAKIKFLAAEALRGVGGLVLDANGKRFANELGRRDYVTGEMWKNKPPFRLCLNKAASDEINWHCKHYTGRGVMKFYESGEALAKDMGISVSVLEQTTEEHYQAAKKTEKDPDGGSFPAYPSGKSWDAASGKTGSGKKFYHNIIPGSAVKTDPFYVAIITPVIHYCMGGLEIDVNSAVLKSDGKPIVGLYAAGEVAGGVHGNNRLGGNSLLDCVVFGRVAGKHAAKYMLGSGIKATSLTELSGGGLSGKVEASKFSGGSYEDTMNKPAGGGGGGLTLEEVAKHNSKADCWVVVSGQVLNVTKFLGEHPGGELAISTFAGKDATEEFDMIHPPDVIGKYAPDAVIGVIGTAASAPAAVGGGAKPVSKDKGGLLANHHAWGHLDGASNWRIEGLTDNPGVLLVNVAAYFNAAWYLLVAVLYEVCATIFTVPNFKISNDRMGLTRSAILLILFIVIHAVGNLHVFMGPDDFNGYGYFYVRLYWTGFGLPANIVEEYILLSVLLHVFVALKRTWDISLAYSVGSGKLNLAITGIALLTFMTVHLFQFRFGEAQMYKVCPPPYLINLWTLLKLQLNLFWVDTEGCTTAEVRDIYRLEFEVFQSVGWCAFYLLSVGIFATHMALGWAKVVPAAAMGIPKGHQSKATVIGYIITAVIALIYASFPIYTHLRPMVNGALSEEPALP